MKSKIATARARSSSRAAPAASNLGSEKSEIVLLAVTGMSPAVLTETIWAFAQERPSIIPNRMAVLPSLAGRNVIERELLTSMEPDNRTVC